MNRKEFWKIIEEARSESPSLVDLPAQLIQDLSRREEREIVAFETFFTECLQESFDAKLWLAAVVIFGGCGDDKFCDFRCWLIAKGQECFEGAILDPDTLADIGVFDGDYGYPLLFGMISVSKRAFCERAGPNSDEFTACEQFERMISTGTHPPLKNEALIQATDQETKLMFPRLATKFPNGIRGRHPH
jgi:hypothetical protein